MKINSTGVMSFRTLFVIGLLVNSILATGRAGAATLFVANNGVDSVSCGPLTNACRSISQGIQNAGIGDTIIVGPGSYGDLDQSGFAGPGDESGPNTTCGCMINVDKDVTIVSRDGAGVTVLDAAGNRIDAVVILASGATFGGIHKGFSIINAGNNGVTISNGLSRVAVIGNRSVANSLGFFVSTGSVSNRLTGNVALENGGNGFEVNGASNFLVGNAANANGGDGFLLFETNDVVTGNLATDNGRDGINVTANSTGMVINHNAVIANARFGITINSNVTAKITQNSIFGNNEPAFNAFGQSGITNGGLVNASFGRLSVADNYYGARTGPGLDPADQVLNFGTGSATTNTSISKVEIKVKLITP